MPACPQCNKPLRELARRCPSCQADLDLLVDYVNHLQGSLERAENLIRAGELGPAVWAYLEVLDVDPDNSVAKRQVGQVATAIRQFDNTSPGRRLHNGRGPEPLDPETERLKRWLRWLLLAGLVVAVFSVGYILGGISWEGSDPTGDDPPPIEKRPDTLRGV